MENVYERIHKNAKRVLEEVGFRIKNIEVKKILENTGIAAYDETTGHIHILQDYTQHCVDIAPKSFKCDPGFNSFGLGGCIPFIEEEPGKFRPVTHKDLERAAKFISKNQDVIKFSHTPIKVVEGKYARKQFECAKIMDNNLPIGYLKGISMAEMRNEKEVEPFVRDDWIHIFCGVESPLNEISEKMQGLIRSARLGAVLGISTMPMAGTLAPQTIEGLLTLCHAEVLFMIVVAQTVNPGVVCIHDGFPCPTHNYKMMFGSIQHAMTNAAMAHLNMEVTKLPTMQSGGGTHQNRMCEKAMEEGKKCREYLRHVGFHMMRHAFGTVDNTCAFNFKKLTQEVEIEREKMKKKKENEKNGERVVIPKDPEVMEVIARNGSRPNYINDDHTLKYIDCWGWHRKNKTR